MTAPSPFADGESSPLSLSATTPGTGPTVRRWRWWIHFVLIGGYVASALPFMFARAPEGPVLSDSATGLVTRSAVQIGIFALVFAAAWLASRATLDQLFLRWRPGWWVVPLGIGYSIAIRIGAGVAALLVIGILLGTRVLTLEIMRDFINRNHPDVEKLVDITALQTNPAYYWLSLTLVSFVLAGLREELWRVGTLAALRALWPSAFGSFRGQVVAIGLIAIVFGVAHFPLGPLGAAVAGIIGFLLGLIIIWHRSIWPAVIAHGLFDATTFALLPLTFERLQQLR